jgi:hypothetical protein
MSNSDHLIDVPTAIGPVTIISVRRKNKPVDLPKPYEYVLTVKQVETLHSKMAKLFDGMDDCNESHEAARKHLPEPSIPGKLQQASIHKKAISKGIRYEVFLLGFSTESRPPRGVTKKQWNEAVAKTQKLLKDTLGKDAKMYIDPFTTERKFQARFSAYIMYREFLKSKK